MKMAKIGPFLFLLNTPTPRRRSALGLGEPEPRVFALSALPRHSSGPPRRNSASPR